MSVLSVCPAGPLPQPPALAEGGAGTSGAPRGRASWSGLLRVSLVSVPVKAYPLTVSSEETHFHQLHADCGERIRYEKHCPVHGKVEAAAIARGYPYAPGQYLLLEEAELDQLRPEKDKALALDCFVDPERIDPALFAGRSLCLLPDGPAAHHPYRVLADALRQRRRWALGQAVLGGHRYLTLVRPSGTILLLHVLHYPAQLRAPAAFASELRDEVVSEDERTLAGQLVEGATVAQVSWSDYRDDTAAQLAALVEAKLRGQPPPTPAPEPAPVLRLLDALRRSVAQAAGSAPLIQEATTLEGAESAPAAEEAARRSDPGQKRKARRRSA
jgi:DNA end-binding protein Ku